jgi:hypothetical protein
MGTYAAGLYFSHGATLEYDKTAGDG